jgi:hypothetical protein
VHRKELTADVKNTVGSGRDRPARCDGGYRGAMVSAGDQAAEIKHHEQLRDLSPRESLPVTAWSGSASVLPSRATSLKPTVALAPDALIWAIWKPIPLSLSALRVSTSKLGVLSVLADFGLNRVAGNTDTPTSPSGTADTVATLRQDATRLR